MKNAPPVADIHAESVSIMSNFTADNPSELIKIEESGKKATNEKLNESPSRVTDKRSTLEVILAVKHNTISELSAENKNDEMA